MPNIVKKYYQEKSKAYTVTNTAVIHSLIPEERPLTILDVGCANGILAQELQQKGHIPYGIELSSSLAKEARKKIKNVIVGNIEEMERLPYPEGTFDAIVFADILEHLFLPAETLRKLKPYLKDSGFIIVSVPNFGYWKIRLQFLLGTVEYQQTGILDEGHIRIFTVRILKKMLRDLGFRLDQLKGVSRAVSPALLSRIVLLRRLKVLQKIAQIVEQGIKERFPSLFGKQIVVKAWKGST